ncbi:hypothetical protein LTR17_013226 [Elasticomyces elasticus]|nr:hypothetical protein LTR17_013226 [Elasticomyces elasticus]
MLGRRPLAPLHAAVASLLTSLATSLHGRADCSRTPFLGKRWLSGEEGSSVLLQESDSDDEPQRKRLRRRERDSDSDDFGGEDVDFKPYENEADKAELSRNTADNDGVLSDHGAIKRRTLDHVAIHGPAYPLSSDHGHAPPAQISQEGHAIGILKARHKLISPAEKSDGTYFQLDNSSVYRPPSRTSSDRHGGELVTLDKLLQHRDGHEHFLFHGVISCCGERHYVQGVKFKILTIDEYGDDDVLSVQGRVCIQSNEAAAHNPDVWYQSGTPSTAYRRFYTPFMWLAHSSKCFVEYLLETEAVDLWHFLRDAQFPSWLQMRYGDHPDYHAWLDEAGLHDFCTTVAANVGFLNKEAHSIESELVGHRHISPEEQSLHSDQQWYGNSSRSDT